MNLGLNAGMGDAVGEDIDKEFGNKVIAEDAPVVAVYLVVKPVEVFRRIGKDFFQRERS